MEKKVVFINDDCLEKFYELYGYEPDEQKKEIQEKSIIQITKASNWQTFYNQFKKIANNAKLKDNFNQQVERLLVELDKFYNQFIDTIYDIDNKIVRNLDIYIENQPVLKNPIMKTISIVLYTYFNMKKINFPNKIKSVNFVSATVKTKSNLYNHIKQNYNLLTKLITDNSYQNRKKYCIDIAKDIIYQLNTLKTII